MLDNYKLYSKLWHLEFNPEEECLKKYSAIVKESPNIRARMQLCIDIFIKHN